MKNKAGILPLQYWSQGFPLKFLIWLSKIVLVFPKQLRTFYLPPLDYFLIQLVCFGGPDVQTQMREVQLQLLRMNFSKDTENKELETDIIVLEDSLNKQHLIIKMPENKKPKVSSLIFVIFRNLFNI